MTMVSTEQDRTNDCDNATQIIEQQMQKVSLIDEASWTNETTIKLQNGGSGAWDQFHSVLGNNEQESSCQQVYQELVTAKFMDKLLPARTVGEAQTNELLTLLAKNYVLDNDTASELLNDNNNNNNNNNDNTSSSAATTRPIRGDRSVFISREYRAQSKFKTNHYHLHSLITKVSTTIQAKLSHCIDFDMNLTSIQLAIYPGDGTSGYTRHCDCGQDSCQQEDLQQQQQQQRRQQQKYTKAQKPHRIITAIYYLTDYDWDVSQDGGCLRLYTTNRNKSIDNDKYVDLAPTRDSLIIFRSDGVQHEVMPSLKRSRTALTMWFYGTYKFSNNNIHGGPMKLESNNNNNQKCVGSIFDYSNIPPLPISIVDGDTDDSSSSNNNNNNNNKDTAHKRIQLFDVKIQPKIFVSIPSYRDPETAPTIDALYATATHPNRIVVGVVLQLDFQSTNDVKIWKDVQSLPWYQTQNIQCLTLDAKYAQGPCYARHLCQSLFLSEEKNDNTDDVSNNFILQIDSHMRFRPNWDEYLIQQWSKIRTNKNNNDIVLTTYPIGYTLPNKIPIHETRTTMLVPWKFDSFGLLRQRGCFVKEQNHHHHHQQEEQTTTVEIATNNHYYPIPAPPLYAAGFMFGPLSMIYSVPYDPTLKQLFFGEELSMAVRLYTHGFDFYTPNETVVYHLWSRSHRPTFHNDTTSDNNDTQQQEQEKKQKEQTKQQSIRRVLGQIIMTRTNNDENSKNTTRGETNRYSLGHVRTVSDFELELGVDFTTQKIVETPNVIIHNKDNHNIICLLEQDSTATSFAPDSLQAKIASLDTSSQALIASFLSQIQ